MNIKPWIHTNVIDILDKIINKNTYILEFGSGNSTIYFSNLTNNLTSIEHNKCWYNKIKPIINNVKYILKEIEYISVPPIDKKFYNCNSLEELIGHNIPDEYYDIIIIDGINRVNCAVGSINKLKKGGILILDDSNRIENANTDGSYKPIKNLVDGWQEYKYRSNDRNTDYWIKPIL